MANGLITTYGKTQMFNHTTGAEADTILGYQLGSGTSDALSSDVALTTPLTTTRVLDNGFPKVSNGIIYFQLTLDSTDEILDGKTISEIGVFMKDANGTQTKLFSHIVFTGFVKTAGSEYVISFQHIIG